MTSLDEIRAWDDRHRTPYPLRSYTAEQLGTRDVDTRRMMSTPEAFNIGVRTVMRPGVRGVTMHDSPHLTAIAQARELYTLRTQSHLYDDWQVEHACDLARTAALRTGRLIADCHGCRTTQAVTPDAVACPTCGRGYV